MVENLGGRTIYYKEPKYQKVKTGQSGSSIWAAGRPLFVRWLQWEASVTSHTPTIRETAAAKWTAAKPVAMGLAIGLIAGPIISGFAGFQVRTSTAQAATRAGVVEQQAAFCAERARAATPDTSALGWQARGELARQWAAMPGTNNVDADVVYACSGKLST